MKNIIIVYLFLTNTLQAQNLYLYPSQKLKSRVSSFENINGLSGQGAQSNKGAKGRAFQPLEAHETKTLLNIHSQGEIQRIWLTLSDRSPEMLRAIRIKMYWDNNPIPAVDVPLGDFFGIALGKTASFQNALFSSPEGKSFNCYIPMPYRKAAKITISNNSHKDLKQLYFDIDFVQKTIPKAAMYFHAIYTRQQSSDIGNDFAFLPTVKGRGRFLGVNMGVIANENYGETWWGEGEIKMYIDTDTVLPTIVGTGTEDYIGTGWELNTFHNTYQGCLIANKQNREYAFYRFHIIDEIFFEKSFKAQIQQIGGGTTPTVLELIRKGVKLIPVTVSTEDEFYQLLDKPENLHDPVFKNGWTNFYRTDDYSATSYFYLDKP
jgi:hypothetical protein